MANRPSVSSFAISRRSLLGLLGAAGGALALGGVARRAEAAQESAAVPSFTGPGANPYWNSVGPYVSEPQKSPLLLLTDRGVQLETPRPYFQTALTPNHVFYVRWHLDEIPNAVDLRKWRLQVEGNVAKPVSYSLADLMHKFPAEAIAAVNQCSGNSRSRFEPRVAGGQWGNGAMGNAQWTGVRLRDLLRTAAPKTGSVQVQFQGLESGPGPEGLGSHFFQKSFDMDNPVLDECVVAYAMNGEPLPMLNGFPVRLVVPGYFATYWTKCLSWIRVLDKTDDNFWVKSAYRIPDTPRGNTTPEDVKAGGVKMIPINRMPVRSFLVSPDGDSKIPAGMPVRVRGIAFSGYGGVTKVDVSSDGLKTWQPARLGDDLGRYSFRTWEFTWTPKAPGHYTVAVRATDSAGNTQPDEGVWNPGGYLWNKIERQDYFVGAAE
ncbi:MAG: molybdopterin-dependent oxidoreductase [Candidatus Acidiferrales bacterium]